MPSDKVHQVASPYFESSASEQDKYEAIFGQIPAAIALLRGPTFIFEMANESYCQLVGRAHRDDLVGKPLIEALPEIVGQPFPDILKKVFETGETFQAKDVEVKLKLGTQSIDQLSTLYVDILYRRVLDREQKPYGIFVFAVDVTEKVVARLSVQNEKQKLEAVFAHASASLAILTGVDSVYEKANSSYLNLFNGRELIGKPLLEALPELQGQKFPDLIRQVFNDGQGYVEVEAEAFLRRTSTSPVERRFFDQSYTRIEDSKGQRYGVLIHAIDVTDRVRARHELAEVASRYQHAINAADMGTWDIDMRTEIADWSPRTSELFGVTHSDKVNLRTAISLIHPEDQERVDQAVRQSTDPKGDGFHFVEYRIRLQDQSIRWVSVRGQCLFEETPSGRVPTRFSGTVLDVTERALREEAVAKSEAQFRKIADLMPQVVWTAKPDGALDYTNHQWTQYSGSSDPEAWLSYVHPEDVGRAVAGWTHSVSTGQAYNIEFRLRRLSDQSYRWFLVRAQASLDSNGQVEKWFGTCTDIEEQKNALAERSNFISVASHELKTPLTSLKLQTQSILRNHEKGRSDAFNTEKLKAFVDNNNKQIGRLVRLVDDMLDFSKIESGKLSMLKEPTDLGELVREAYERLKEQLESGGCATSFECSVGVHALVDRFRIEQVVTNLLTNAIRYGLKKPVEIRVTEEEGFASIRVKDHGMGIAKENQDRIFNRFERAVSADQISGLGLGLFISREIAEGHQGTLTVESEPGQGSTFQLKLPIGAKTSLPVRDILL